jgi:predicted permease
MLVEYHSATADYFRAMGIRLLEGRIFDDADVQRVLAGYQLRDEATERGARLTKEQTNALVSAVVINESMARFFWPGQSPIGQMFSQGSDNGPWRQVIGVVSDSRQWGLTSKPRPEAFDPFVSSSRLFLVLHTSLPPAGLTPQVRNALGQIDPSLPLFSVRTMNQVIGENAQGQQFLSLLVGSFAAIAMLLAAVGIYGVLSYVVTQRTREIGIRMSLGASRGRVLAEVMWDGMRLSVVGFAAGIVGAIAASRVLRSMLHEVKPGDPLIFVATAGLLAAVALIACYLPARRAAKLDPMRALRYE